MHLLYIPNVYMSYRLVYGLIFHQVPGTYWCTQLYFLPEAYVQQYVIYVLVCIEFTADSVQLSLQMDQQQQ